MKLRRSVVLILSPLVVLVVIILGSWLIDPKLWYFRGYEFYSDWVYPGLSEPNNIMRESGDSAREFLIDRINATNEISLNRFGHRVSPCEQPNILAMGDSQLFGSGISDQQTLPFKLFEGGGPCVYNAGRHNTVDALRIPNLNFTSVLVTSTERDGFTWYCDSQPENWDFSKSDASALYLKRLFAPRVAFETAIERTISVIRSKVQNLLGLRIQAPMTRLIKFQHTFTTDSVMENVECVDRLNTVFVEHGMRTSFLLFPAAQTIYPDDAPIRPDNVTLNFIPSLTAELQARGIHMLDSRVCLLGQTENMVQLHDTHLSPEGMQRLADCLRRSKILVDDAQD
jgi:hypothetical protein